MNEAFQEYVDALHPAFDALCKMQPVTADELPPGMPREGIYLFSEGEHGSSLFCVGSFGGPAPPAPRHFALCGPADRRG